SPDFSRFAVVEYAEDNVGLAPGHIYIGDPAGDSSFAVPAPPAAYGVAFAPSGRYIYVGSAQRGTISRIDVSAGKIDKTVPGPRPAVPAPPGHPAERHAAVRARVGEHLHGVRPAGPQGALRRDAPGRARTGDGAAPRPRHRLARRCVLRRARRRGSAQRAHR